MKGLIGKIFGKQEKAFQERSPRVRLLFADEAALDVGGKKYPLLNFSETGAAVEDPAAQLPATLVGKVLLPTGEISVAGSLARRVGSMAGIKFEGDLAALRAALRKAFSEEIRATEMSEVAKERLRVNEEEGQPRWFYTPGNFELFFLEKEGKPIRLEIEWGGTILSARAGEGIRVGVLDAEDRQKPSHAKSDLVKWSEVPSEEAKAKAKRILENVPGLEEKMRDQLKALIA